MADLHQSYEDFRLDALLQYDLADDVEEEDAADSESVHSGIIDEATFDKLYTSIPDVIYDDDNTSRKKETFIRSPSLMNVTMLVRNVSSRNRLHNRQADEETHETFKPLSNKQHSGLLQSISIRLRPKRITSKRLFLNNEQRVNRRGIERNISSKTEGTISSLEDVALNQSDDLSCSVCYLDEEEDEYGNNLDECNDDKIKNLDCSASVTSEVFADNICDSGNDNNDRHDEPDYNKLHCSFESNCNALADACYDVILNNNSMDTAISLDIDDCDNDDYDDHDDHDDSQIVFTTNDPMLNRSLPIIEARGLQDLFFDDYDHNNILADRCHRSVTSTFNATGYNSRHRRLYTISDF